MLTLAEALQHAYKCKESKTLSTSGLALAVLLTELENLMGREALFLLMSETQRSHDLMDDKDHV